ncbi:ABC transporter permease, partial [Candidatus Marinamargulisbacteria bacterium SCGC AG-410-N11]
MMSIITNSYSNVASTFFGTKFQKNIEELLVSPLKPQTIVLGYISGGIFRGICIGFLVSIIATFFSSIQIHNITLIILTAILTSTFFSLCGMINGIFAKKFDDIAIIPTFILTPLTYLGGVFYPMSILPEFWQNISYLNPMIYLINIFRFGFIGVSDIPILNSFIFLLIITLTFWQICILCLKKGIGIKE